MDVRTLLILSGAISVAAAIVMAATWLRSRTYPGFGWWTLGIAAIAGGSAMFPLTAAAQSGLVLVIRNGLLLGGLLCIPHGLLVFRGREANGRWELACLGTFLALLAYFSQDLQGLNARIILFSLYAGVVSLVT